MAVAEIPFGAWLPDAPTYNNPGCVVANNVIPSTRGYDPFLGAVETEDAVTGTAKGARQLFDNSGTSIIVGGTATTLFVRNTSGLTETTGYTDPGEDAWDFARFNDFVIATSQNNAPQYLTDIDTDTSFSALTGSPPNARRCAKVGEFLMLGNVDTVPNRIQWSAYNNPAGDWTPSRLTQAGFADLESEFGGVQRIIGGRFALVFQERGIQRLTYVGPPTVWKADIVSRDRGTIAPFSVANVGYRIFFLGQDGFYATDGSSFQPIGTQQINEWFLEHVSQSALPFVCAAVDWQNECVVWAFREAAEGYNDRLLIYSWAQDRWSSGSINTQWIVSDTNSATTLEDLDSYGSLEAVPYSLDSEEWQAQNQCLSGFTPYGNDSIVTAFSQAFSGAFASAFAASSTFVRFTGDPVEAEFETGEFQPKAGSRVFADELRVMMDADSWDMQAELVIKDNRNNETSTGLKEAGWAGFCPVRGEGMMMRARVVKPGGSPWSDAQGIQVQYRVAGQR